VTDAHFNAALGAENAASALHRFAVSPFFRSYRVAKPVEIRGKLQQGMTRYRARWAMQEPKFVQQCSTFEKSAKCDARCAALGPEFGLSDTELTVVIDVWPSLTEAVRANILATVRAASGAG
jgi:hypothetical protein